LSEMPEAIDKGRLMLMHCVAAYPAPKEDAVLANITLLKKEFRMPVGYSDHTLGIKACELAVEQQEQAWSALRDYAEGNADFSDYLIAHLNRSAGCEYTVSFDKNISNHRLVRLLK